MKVIKDDIINCGKYFIHGLNSGYRNDTINGKNYEMDFCNVLICNSADIDKATWTVWDRVWKTTEQEDKKRILLFGFGPALLEAFDYAKMIVNNTDNYHSEVSEWDDLLNKLLCTT